MKNTMKLCKKAAASALCWLLAAAPARAAVAWDVNASPNNYHIAWDGSASGGSIRAMATGDLNGDGIDDVVMIEGGADTQSRTNNGAAYIVYGVQKSTGGIVKSIATTYNVRIDGASSSDQINIAGVWDMNNDGQDDLIVRTSGATTWWVLYGPFPAGTGNIYDLATASKYNLKITAPGASGPIYAYGPADLNGDGIDDLFIEVPLADVGTTDTGSLYVMYGPLPAGTGNTRDLGTSTDWNLRINGPAVASAWLTISNYDGYYDRGTIEPNFTIGDINDDGAPDLAVGAARADSWQRTDNGSVWITTGPFPSGTGNSWTVTDTDRFMLRLDGALDADGLAKSIIADFNGDGKNDLCVGAAMANEMGRSNNGAVYCLYGPLALPHGSTRDLDVDANYNVMFYDVDSWQLGYDGLYAVDVNNDGVKDLSLNSLYADPGTTNTGAVYLLYGGAAGSWPAGTGNQKDLTTATNYNVLVTGDNNASDQLAVWPPLWKDLNADGALDMLVSSRGENGDSCSATFQSQVSVFYGPMPAGTGQSKNVATNYDLRFRYSNCNYFGDAPQLAADLDGDGIQDLILSYYLYNGPPGADSGRVYSVGLSTPTARITSPNLFTNSLTPTVTWAGGSAATSFWLQVASDPSFSAGAMIYENTSISAMSQATSALTSGSSYYARVRTNNGNFSGQWGPIVTFTVDTTAPTEPTLVTPGDATGTHPSIGSQTPAFDWSDASTE